MPKPAGVGETLKTVLQSHPDRFILAKSGDSCWQVSIANLPESLRAPHWQTEANYARIDQAVQQGNIERLQETAQRLSFRQFLAGITCNLADLPPSREMFRGLYDSWRQLARQCGQTKIQAPSSHLSFLKGYGCVALDESSSTLTWNIEKLRTTTEEIVMLLPKVYHL